MDDKEFKMRMSQIEKLVTAYFTDAQLAKVAEYALSKMGADREIPQPVFDFLDSLQKEKR